MTAPLSSLPRDFAPRQGLGNEGILCVFQVPAPMSWHKRSADGQCAKSLMVLITIRQSFAFHYAIAFIFTVMLLFLRAALFL